MLMADGDILKLKEIEKYSVQEYLEHLEYIIDKQEKHA